MYNRHFGLSAAPFRITPDTRRFFGGGQRAEILDTLIYAISRGEGMVKVTGEIGTGKTMLCRMLQEHLPTNVEIVYLGNPGLNSHDIIAAIAMELGLPVAADTPSLHLHQQLQNYLLHAHQQGRQVVVFVEEAQRMPLQTLEAIRLLSNLETGQAKLLQLVLFGQPELNQHLDKHEIRQLKDRITHSFGLTPLSAATVRDYVRFRLHGAGYTGNELFTGPAYRQLAWSSAGLIRRLHVLADKALLAAFAQGCKRVHWQHVQRAARDDTPARQRRFRRVAAGLGGGLATGLALAIAAIQLSNHWQRLVPIASAPVRPSVSQNIDDARRMALAMRPAAGMPLVSERLQASRQWLADSQTGELTIQLLLSEDDDLAKMEKLLSNQPYKGLLSNIYLYRSEVNGRQRWNVLYGEFDSKSQALTALADLPATLQVHQPYLRSLTALRDGQPVAGWSAHKDEHG
jgi:MSHA biogenesis protein MshM